MSLPPPFPAKIAPGNDLVVVLGPATTVSTATAQRAAFAGGVGSAWLSATKTGTVPLGGTTVTVTESSTATYYVVKFDATEVNLAFAAAPGLADGDKLYVITSFPGDAKGYVELTVELARQLG